MRWVVMTALGATILVAQLRIFESRQSRVASNAPYAAWRAGRIVAISHCSTPLEDQTYLACADLYCQAAIGERLPEPQHARISPGIRVDSPDIRYVRLVGTIEYGTAVPSKLPRGYACELEGLTVHTATLVN